MARGTSEHTQTIYLNIRGGKVTEKKDGPGEGIVARTIEKGEKKGQVVHERQDGFVEGIIKGLTTQVRTKKVNGRDKEMKTLQVTLDDVGERYVLNLPRGYKVWRHFLLSLPNIKPGEPVRFEPYDYVRKSDNARKTGLGLKQNGENVNWAFRRDDGKLPDAPLVQVNGENVVDYTAQDAFLDEVLEMHRSNFGSAPAVMEVATTERSLADIDPDEDFV